MSLEEDQGVQVEAALLNAEVKATRNELVDLLKTNRASAFLASRFERGAKVKMTSDVGSIDTVHQGNGGFHDVVLFDGLNFAPKGKMFEGMTGWASSADNRNDLKNQGIIKYDALLNTEAAGGPPVLVTLVTDQKTLQGMGFDQSMDGYCLIAAEVAVETNKMLDSYGRQGVCSTMKYIVPTEMGKKIAKVVQQEGPAAAWAIMFDAVGYRLRHGSDVDYGVPKVDLGDKKKIGVAYIGDKGVVPAPVKDKSGRKWFGR